MLLACSKDRVLKRRTGAHEIKNALDTAYFCVILSFLEGMDLLDIFSLVCLIVICLSVVFALFGHYARRNGYVKR
jgi:predicted exporter